MRIALVAHGLPPEAVGGVELSVRALARSLSALGHEVLVIAGTLEQSREPGRVEVRRATLAELTGPGAPGTETPGPGATSEAARELDARISVARLARHDLFFDHWQKSLCLEVSQAFRALLREFQADVVHVHHWLRLSRDLVLAAARERVPAVVTLHDAWTSCPIAFRVRPDTRASCEAVVGPHPCVACAGKLGPRTPWVPVEAAFLLVGERQRDLAAELELARARIAPSAAHARALERWLGAPAGSLAAAIVPPCAELPPLRELPAASDGESPFPFLWIATWSQIAPHKGLDLVLDAVLAARDELGFESLVHLEVLGAEADPAYAEHLRATAGEASVRFRGPFLPEELGERIAIETQVFVAAPRAHESYGLSADEAARLGLALVLPDSPAYRERFDAVAEFYPQGDARALADVLVRLGRQPGRRAHARRAAREFGARLSGARERALRHVEIYAAAIQAGAPQVAAEDWFQARMNREALAAWDRAISGGGARPGA